MDRCLNCGKPDHSTVKCETYGPRYMEPGKTLMDYEDEHRRIMDLVARDIIAEHEGHDTAEVEL